MKALLKKNLLGLPVETQFGVAVGTLADIEIDTELHLIENYKVKTSKLLPGLFSKSLLIGRQQVVAITADKIVVEDSVVTETGLAWNKKTAPAMGGSKLSSLDKN